MTLTPLSCRWSLLPAIIMMGCAGLSGPSTGIDAVDAESDRSRPDSTLIALLDLGLADDADASDEILEDAQSGTDSDPGIVLSSQSTSSGTRLKLRANAASGPWSTMIAAESDPGESWAFVPGRGKAGFDHVAGFITGVPRPGTRIVLGTIRHGFGLGLVQATPRLGSLVSTAWSSARILRGGKPLDVRGYAGSDEDRYMNGIALQSASGPVQFSLVASRRTMDADVGEPVHLRTGGDHVTELQRSRQDRLPMRTAAASIALNQAGTVVAAHYRLDTFEVPAVLPGRGAESAARSWPSMSVFARTSMAGFSASAEYATSGHRPAFLLFVTVRSGRTMVLGGFRTYDTSFATFFGAPPSFRGGAPGNETGTTWSVRHRRAAGHLLESTYDLACLKSAETDHPFGGCRQAASVRFEVERPAARWVLLARADHDAEQPLMTSPERTRTRLMLSLGTRLTLSHTVEMTAAVRLRKTRERPDDSGTAALSSVISAGVVVNRRGWTVTLHTVDHHVTGGIMATYEPPLPLASGLRTLSGDGWALQLGIRRTGRRILIGWSMRIVANTGIDRTDPSPAVTQFVVGLH